MVGWLSVLLFVAAGLNIFLGSVVLARDWRQVVNWVFFILTLTVGLWDIGISAFIIVQSDLLAFDWAKVFYASALLLVFMLVCFAEVFPSKKRLSPKFLVLFGLPVAVLIALLYLLPDFIILNVYTNEFGRGVSVNLNQYFFYSLVVVLYFAVSLFKLFIKSRRLKGTYRSQASQFFIAGALTAAIGLWFDLILPHWLGNYSLVWVGPLATTVFAVSCAINIIQYGLFDIKVTTMRAIAYILSLATLAGIYYALAFVISNIILRLQPGSELVVSPINIALALILAFVFQPIKKLFDRFTNFIFFRDSYETNEFFARLTQKISAMSDLYTLLHYAASEISGTLKSEFGAFYIHEKGERRIFVTTDKRQHLPAVDVQVLDTYVKTHNANIVITNALDADNEIQMRRMLTSHRVALALPIFEQESITSYLFLGDHLSSHYTTRDIKALETIVDELAIAIRNALSLHEVKHLNATLQQRVNSATKELRASNAQLQRLDEAKDEFISMASHQLRTPLTSIKGYISMLMEGDVGKVSPDQKHLLQEAFVSSERMVRLIGDFLNVSRLQTGKFVIEKQPVDLAKLVGREIESLGPNAAARNLTFEYKQSKNFPVLSLDESKIQQVIMNFADNALYYSKENTKIKVSLAVVKDRVEFKVKDTGIGVPLGEQSNLFSKFYRASNARKQRPDGTGVGLFLAKKVIDAHDGKVVFESKENKGSTFGFSLPLSKLRVRDAD
jgi:signal transduction histidine kinase